MSAGAGAGTLEAKATRAYYQINGAAISYSEYWRLSPFYALPFLWALKLFKVQFALARGLPEPSVPKELPETDLSPAARKSLLPLVGDFRAIGFDSPFFYRLTESLLPGNDGGAAAFLHRDGECWANLLFSKAGGTEKCTAWLTTHLENGRLLVTGNGKKELDDPPVTTVHRLPGASPADLLAAHRSALHQVREQTRRAAWPGAAASRKSSSRSSGGRAET